MADAFFRDVIYRPQQGRDLGERLSSELETAFNDTQRACSNLLLARISLAILKNADKIAESGVLGRIFAAA